MVLHKSVWIQSPLSWELPPSRHKSDGEVRVSWCRKHTVRAPEIRQGEAVTVGGLVVGIFREKFLSDPL